MVSGSHYLMTTPSCRLVSVQRNTALMVTEDASTGSRVQDNCRNAALR